VPLDLNGNGQIGWRELNTASPVRGSLNANNQPLVQTFALAQGRSGNYLPLDQFPKSAGIPVDDAQLPELRIPRRIPTDLLRAQVRVGRCRCPASCRWLRARSAHGGLQRRSTTSSGAAPARTSASSMPSSSRIFADLVYDVNPDFTMKNQLFFDSIHQYKISNQPLWLTQNVWVWKTSSRSPSASRPARVAEGQHPGVVERAADHVEHRQRLRRRPREHARRHHRRSALDQQFRRALSEYHVRHTHDNPDLNNDGSPLTADGETVYTEYGLGLMWDVDLFEKTNVLLGARYDKISAKNEEFAGTFNTATGTAANPGAFRAAGEQRQRVRHGSFVQPQRVVQDALESAAVCHLCARQRAARRRATIAWRTT
jgi:hypothetical protein